MILIKNKYFIYIFFIKKFLLLNIYLKILLKYLIKMKREKYFYSY